MSDEWRFALESLIQILAPFAPHITEELWHEMGHDDTVHVGHWPKWDEKYLKSSVMTIIVQVNGKLRAKLELPSDMDKQGVEAAALADENVQKFTNNKPPKKIVYVPGKLVNIVVQKIIYLDLSFIIVKSQYHYLIYVQALEIVQ